MPLTETEIREATARYLLYCHETDTEISPDGLKQLGQTLGIGEERVYRLETNWLVGDSILRQHQGYAAQYDGVSDHGLTVLRDLAPERHWSDVRSLVAKLLLEADELPMSTTTGQSDHHRAAITAALAVVDGPNRQWRERVTSWLHDDEIVDGPAPVRNASGRIESSMIDGLSEVGRRLLREIATAVDGSATTTETEPTSSDDDSNLPLIFVSHKTSDSDFVGTVVALLRASLLLGADRIRCSSLPGHKFPPSTNLDDQIRNEVMGCQFLIGVITPSSRESDYVMFELGARWGSGKPYVCLLAGGDSGLLPSPLRGIVASRATRDELLDFVDMVAHNLHIPKQPASAWDADLDRVVEAAMSCHQRGNP